MEANPSPIKQLASNLEEDFLLTMNPLLFIRDEQTYRSKIIELNDQGVKHINIKDYNKSLEYLFKGLDMVNLYKSTNKQINPLIEICLNYNIVSLYEAAWLLDNCYNYSVLTLQLLKEYVQKTKDQIQIIHLNLFIFKFNLQFCAILSQLGKHQQALKLSHENRNYYLKTLKEIQQKITSMVLEEKIQNQAGSIIYFNKKIQKSVERLKGLVDMINGENTENRQSIYLYNWKNNPQNNQKHIKQCFRAANEANNSSMRSLLGVTQDNWLNDFNIGSVMHISPKTYEEFSHIPCILQQATNKKVEQKILLASILHFTISTQMRLIENTNSQPVNDRSKKHKKQTKIQYSKQAQKTHLKALSLVCRNFPSSFPYMNHLINTFHKHYLQDLKQIQQKDESYINDISLSNKVFIQQVEQIQVNNYDNICLDYHKTNGDLKISGVETQLIVEGHKNQQKSTKPHSKPKYSQLSEASQDHQNNSIKKISKLKLQANFCKQVKIKRKSRQKGLEVYQLLQRNKSKNHQKDTMLQKPKTLSRCKSTRSVKSTHSNHFLN